MLGPNGGGKTTLFRALLGELRAAARHRSAVDGPRRHRPADRALAAGLPGVRARRRADGRAARAPVVAAPGRAERRRRAGRARAASAWPTGPTTTFGELSGGQRQRVLVARALLQDARGRAVRRALHRPRRPERRPADDADRHARRRRPRACSSPPTTSPRRRAGTTCCASTAARSTFGPPARDAHRRRAGRDLRRGARARAGLGRRVRAAGRRPWLTAAARDDPRGPHPTADTAAPRRTTPPPVADSRRAATSAPSRG